MPESTILDPPAATPEIDEADGVYLDSWTVRLRPVITLDAEQLAEFCALNGDLRVEMSADGELIVMAPTAFDSGWQNAKLTADFVIWSRNAGGVVCDSSTLFKLPNGAFRSPDVSWITSERCAGLTEKERHSFAPICPDFVLELRSRTDRLPKVKEKMEEYLANGARLGWLIDPLEKQVFIYRPDAPVEHLKNPATLSGEQVLAGFALDLARVW